MNMREKLLLAAMCVALPAAASAQAPAAPTAGVKVGGTLNVNFQITQAKGATDPAQSVKARNAVSSDSSNVYVDAFAEVAFGLKAIGRCETSATVDSPGSSVCNRNSRVGLSSAQYGTLFYGNWDTPFKSAAYGTKADDPFQNTDVFGYQGIMGSPGYNYKSSGWVTSAVAAVGGFDIRANNSVAYHSPKVAGLSAKLQYASSEAANADGTSIPQLLSAGVNYEWQGLSVLAAYERHYDTYGLSKINGVAASASQNSVDQAWRVGAGYMLDTPAGATTVGVLVDQVMFKSENLAVGAVKDYKRLAWQVAAKHRYGDHELRARFNMAMEGDCSLEGGGTCNAGDKTGAKQIALGYAYHLAKSTQAYLSYTRIMNDDAASYTLTIGGSSAVAGSTPAGADPQALGLGVRFAF